MEAENIKTRIAIGRQEEGDVAYIYDYNMLKFLNIPEDKEFKKNYFLDIGTEFEFNDEKFRIKSIRTMFYEHTWDMSHPPGGSSTEFGVLMDFNFQLMYFVEDID